MKTEYTARIVGQFTHTGDIDFLRENYRKPGAKLFRRESEAPEEAAVRRMAALDNWQASGYQPDRSFGIRLSTFADFLSPPPPVKEVEIDWDTLEPIKEVPVWENEAGVWTAGFGRSVWVDFTIEQKLVHYCVNRTAAIGHTRESALRNLAEMQGGRK